MFASFDQDLSRLVFACGVFYLVVAPLGVLLLVHWVRLLRRLFALAQRKEAGDPEGAIQIKATLYTKPNEQMPQDAIEAGVQRVLTRLRASHTQRGNQW